MSQKYQLETIPVWRALEQESECILCDLEIESERRNTEFFLGSALMAPEMRVELNRSGFCPRHFHMLEDGSGKLGLSLVLATHIDELSLRIQKLTGELESAGASRKSAARSVERLSGFLEDQERECLMCGRILHNLGNYSYTMVKLFQTDDAFREALENSRGICLHHAPMVLRTGIEILKPSELPSWHRLLADLMTSNLNRLSGELEQFTWQFDATSAKTTPESAKDAVSRAIRKLAGRQ